MESGHPKNRLLYSTGAILSQTYKTFSTELCLTDGFTVTPERLSSPAFKKRLAVIHKQRELNRLVVDEAHCISECKCFLIVDSQENQTGKGTRLTWPCWRGRTLRGSRLPVGQPALFLVHLKPDADLITVPSGPTTTRLARSVSSTRMCRSWRSPPRPRPKCRMTCKPPRKDCPLDWAHSLIQLHSVKELGLDLKTLQKFVHPFNRKNLYYEVSFRPDSQP